MPIAHRRQSDVRVDRLLEGLRDFFRVGQICIGQLLICPRMRDRAVAHFQGAGVYLPLPGGKACQQLAGGGRRLTHRRNILRRGPAAGRDAVVGDLVGIGHDQMYPADGNPQLFRRRLRQLGPRPLALLDFAAHRSNRAVLIQIKPRQHRRVATSTAAATPLSQREPFRHRDDDPRSDDLYERAAGQVRRATSLVRRLQGFPRTLGPDLFSHGSCLRILPAAQRRALVIFTYPLHRQMFPFIPATISSSVGSGFSASKATADRIMPGVQ